MNQQDKIDRVAAARDMMDFCESAFQYVVETITDIKAEVARSTLTIQELVDISYFINKSAKYCEESEKFIKLTHETIGNIACYSWMMLPEHVNMAKAPSIKAKYAYGIPNMKLHLRIPSFKKDPDKFIEFMAAIGVDKEAAVSGNVQVHYPRVCELAQRRFEQGLPNLPHVDTTDMWPVYRLTTREISPRKGEVELPDEQEEN